MTGLRRLPTRLSSLRSTLQGHRARLADLHHALPSGLVHQFGGLTLMHAHKRCSTSRRGTSGAANVHAMNTQPTQQPPETQQLSDDALATMIPLPIAP